MPNWFKILKVTILICILLGVVGAALFSLSPRLSDAVRAQLTATPQHNSTPVVKPDDRAPSLAGWLTGQNLLENAAYCTRQPDNDADKWVRDYRCSLTRADVISTSMLVGVSFIGLMIAGGLLWVINLLARTQQVQVKLMGRQLAAAVTTANAAEKAANIAIAVELPIFVIEYANLSTNKTAYFIRLGNHGRTPALVKAYCLELTSAVALPDRPEYPVAEDLTRDRLVEKTHYYEISKEFAANKALVVGALDPGNQLWAYGYIDYLDFLKRSHREGFCIRIQQFGGEVRWGRGGPSGYTYNKSLDTDDHSA